MEKEDLDFIWGVVGKINASNKFDGSHRVGQLF
jgi:hypothetical protein